jgi:hypothetical protein
MSWERKKPGSTPWVMDLIEMANSNRGGWKFIENICNDVSISSTAEGQAFKNANG